MMCCGVGRSGLPIPRSMMSAPRARAAALSRLTSAKTYGGRRLTRWNSSITGNARVVGGLATSLLAPRHDVGQNVVALTALRRLWLVLALDLGLLCRFLLAHLGDGLLLFLLRQELARVLH